MFISRFVLQWLLTNLIFSEVFYCSFSGKEYIWWLLSDRNAIFKVCISDDRTLNFSLVYLPLTISLFFFPILLKPSLQELQVHYNGERSRYLSLKLSKGLWPLFLFWRLFILNFFLLVHYKNDIEVMKILGLEIGNVLYIKLVLIIIWFFNVPLF